MRPHYTTSPIAIPDGPAVRFALAASMRWALLAALALAALPTTSQAQVRNAGYEADYAASGFVAPAGMPSPEAYYSRVEQASFFGNGGPISSQMSGCDGGCGNMGCDGSCGMMDCGGGYCDDGSQDGGILGHGLYGGGGCACGGCGMEGCGACGGLTNWRFMCLFCRGGGCSVCQSIRRPNVLGCLGALLPYGDAGLCAQRWYDVSADVMFLSHSRGSTNQVLTTQGIAGAPVLRANDADDDGLEAGGRISAAFIFGAGGNVEATYLGGQEWGDSAVAPSPTPTLFSFLSDFGVSPNNGFDDSDRSFEQSVSTFSTFHSAEINYRRRTVEQFCRFQGSWLVGLRYLRFDDDFRYSTTGQQNNAGAGLLRFLDVNNGVDNKMFGVQSGFDLWWNVIAGVNLGIGLKGAWLDNNIDRHSSVFANSAGPGATPGVLTIEDGIKKSTVMAELETTLLYRISHSWTLKTQYYVLGVDDVAYGFDVSPAQNLFSAGAIPVNPISTSRLTIQGVAFGAEYIW